MNLVMPGFDFFLQKYKYIKYYTTFKPFDAQINIKLTMPCLFDIDTERKKPRKINLSDDRRGRSSYLIGHWSVTKPHLFIAIIHGWILVISSSYMSVKVVL